MTNSDRYSPDDYNADDYSADDYNADQIGATQIDEDVAWHQGTDKTNRVVGNRAPTNKMAKTALPKEITSKETTMKALAQQELVANSNACRKALATISSQSKPLQKGTQTAGTGIVWTLLGIGLAACSDIPSAEGPVTKVADTVADTSETKGVASASTRGKSVSLAIAGDRRLVEDGGIANGTKGDSVIDGNLDFTDIDAELDASALWTNQNFNIELLHKTLIGSDETQETGWSGALRGSGDGDSADDDAVNPLSPTVSHTGAAQEGVHAGKTANMLFRAYNVEHGTVYIYDDTSWRFVLNQNNAEVQGLNTGQTMTKTFSLTVVDSKNGRLKKVELTVTINGTNDAPIGSHQTKNGVREDVAASFTAYEFTAGAKDVDAGQIITHVVITDLPANGRLYLLGGRIVTEEQEIAIEDIPNLRYTSGDVDGDGVGHGTLKFKLKDNGKDNNLSAEYTMQINVAPVPDDAPEEAADGGGGDGAPEEAVDGGGGGDGAPEEAVADGGGGEGQALRGSSGADKFIIDTKASVKADADTITGFDLAQDSITFEVEGGGAPASDFNKIWLKKDGDDLLITTSNDDGAANVLGVLKGFFPNPLPDDYDFTKSLVNFDISFIADWPKQLSSRKFEVRLAPDLPGVTGDTRISDGSAAGSDYLYGSEGNDIDAVYIKIDTGTSTRTLSEKIGGKGRFFRDGVDKIILAGDVESIIAVPGRLHTTLYKNEEGDDSVLAIIYNFKANSDNFDITDFLVQPGQVFTVEAPPAPPAPSGDTDKDDYSGDSTDQTFSIDTKASTKADADVITNFGLANDKITFVAEGGGTPANSFNKIWLKKDGDDILITTSDDDGTPEAPAANVLAVLKDVLKDVAADFDFKESLVDFDLSFFTANGAFQVVLDAEFLGVTGDTRIMDGSAEGRNNLTGSRGNDLNAAYLKIDTTASDKGNADYIGGVGAFFQNDHDKIILAGAGTNIYAQYDGKRDTILYNDANGSAGSNNVLAVIYAFQATDANFDITDFLVQDGQEFTVDVL